MSAENMIIYAGWYTPSAWNRMKELAIDRDEMVGTYEDFIANFNKQLRDWQAAGETVTVIQIDVDHMVAWLKRYGIPLDGVGRAAYGAALGGADGDKAKMDEIEFNDPHHLIDRVN